jgi:RNA-directed DNA polymerase
MIFNVPDVAALSRLLEISSGELFHLASRPDAYYRNKTIPKKDGTLRQLRVPRGALKVAQQKIKERILDQVPTPAWVHGGVRRKSPKTNASVHVGKPLLYTIDIESFFPSVTPLQIRTVFRELGFGEPAVRLLACLTTSQFQLPQGTHTSTALANLVLRHIDWRIVNLGRIHGFDFSRFVDDVSASGTRRLYKLRRLIDRIVESQGFGIKSKKRFSIPAGMQQVVTGLTVNEKVNLTRENRQTIRREVLTEARARKGKLTASTGGRLGWLTHINPDAGAKLLARAVAEGKKDGPHRT